MTVCNQRVILSRDREMFKKFLRRRLIECGWRDQVRMLCQKIVKENEGMTFDMMVTDLTPRAHALVPDAVKKELLQKITMTVNNTIAHQRLILSGDRERFKELLRRRLIECGWKDQVRMLCREIVKENEGSNLTLDMMVTNVTPRARALVPDAVKKELLQKLKTHLLTQKDQ